MPDTTALSPSAPLRRHLLRHAAGGLAVAVAIGVSLGIVGCASWMGPRTVDVSQADMQAKLAQKFPIQRQVLGYLNITASAPQLRTLPADNRLSAQVALLIDDTMFNKQHSGHVRGSFALRYEPGDHTIRLDQVRLDELAMPTLPSYFLDALQRLGNQVARDALQGFVIKKLRPEELQRADRLGYEVKGLRVTAGGLAIDLVPKADPPTPPATAHATP